MKKGLVGLKIGKSLKDILKNTRKKFNILILSLIVATTSIFFLFPLVVTVSNSFMGEMEIYENYKAIDPDEISEEKGDIDLSYVNIKLIPDQVSLSQYYTVLVKKTEFLFFFWNSVKIVLPIIVGQVVVAAMAAFAFDKFNFRFKDNIYFIYIVTMLMPFQVTLVPNYIMVDKLGMLGSISSIIIPGIFSTYGVFLLRQFMTYIPKEYMEAAKVDGAGYIRIFIHIIIPLIKSGMVSLAILLFIDNWNMVEQPLIFLKLLRQYPLSIILSRLGEIGIGVAFAASSLYMCPLLLVFLYGEDYIVEGMQLSGIKG